jgi:methyl-accepting chemotaxis protein
MWNLTQLRIRWLIGIGYSFPIILLIAATFLIQSSVQRAHQAVHELDAYNILEKEGDEVAFQVEHLRIVTRCYMLDPTPKILQELQWDLQKYQALSREYQTKIDNSAQQKIFSDYMQQVDQEILFLQETLMPLINQGEITAARQIWHEQYYGEVQNNIENLMKQFRDTGEITYQARKQEQDAALSRVAPLIWQVSGVSVLVAIATGSVIITALIKRLNAEAVIIASSCSEMAATVTEQDRTASEQASSVNETTISIEQLRRSAEQSALQAESAALGARKILNLAIGDREHSENGSNNGSYNGSYNGSDNGSDNGNGTACLQKTSEEIAVQVQSLHEELNQIYRITNVVTELANQTNILALNAAVEAVHAGDQGKGFAVLASEIRKLADRSRESSQKINQLIENLQKSANSTMTVTQKGSVAVEHIVKEINDISINVQQIALNVQEQASAINQVTIAMNTINTGVQQTSSSISQTKVGIEQLDETAQHLKALV